MINVNMSTESTSGSVSGSGALAAFALSGRASTKISNKENKFLFIFYFCKD